MNLDDLFKDNKQLNEAFRQLGVSDENLKILYQHISNCVLCQTRGAFVLIRLKRWIDDCLEHVKVK